MQIVVNIVGGAPHGQEDVLFIEVSPDTTIKTLKDRIEFQSTITASTQRLYHNSSILSEDSKTMEQCQITPDSMLGLQVVKPSSRPAQNPASGASQAARPSQQGSTQTPSTDYEQLRQQYLQSPSDLANLRQQAPPLADAVNDPQKWREIFEEFQKRRAELEAQRERDLALLEADPFDVEAQTRIEEMIRLQQVDDNLEQTREYHPEAFGRVIMLYIDVEVNGHKLKAFVDSGAQSTIMSPECAQRCSIMRLLDTRFSGIAKGVGTAKILGRVHSATIKIGSSHFPSSFTVMEGKDVDLLLGLDMLKRYQACIDLTKNVLRIHGDEVSFLGEADIPKTELDRQDEPTVEGPEGTKIGGISGTVKDPGAPQSSPTPAPSTSDQAESSRTGQAASESQRPTFPEADIAKLTDMGMGRTEAIQALTIAGGNVDAAAGLFF